MRHRHIKDGYEDTVVAVEDVLARGTVADWRELAERIRRDPTGPAADSLRTVLEHVPMYGTTTIWRDFLQRLKNAGSSSIKSATLWTPGHQLPQDRSRDS